MIFTKKTGVLAGIAAVVTLSIAAHQPAKPGDDGFKNLKILPKNISHDSLMGLMHGFNNALGVKCNFCHAPNKDNPSGWPDFASDDKPEKDIARHMMTMTMDINKNYFNWNGSTQGDTITVVRCMTCHHGNPHPDEASMMMSPDQDHPAPPPPGNMPPPGNPPGQ